MKYLILTEKPSAKRNFSKALGGDLGSFDGFGYELFSLRGHVMQLKDPADMVDESKRKKYKSWDIKNLPWNPSDFSWQRTYVSTRNLKTKKNETSKSLLDEFKKSAQKVDGIIIATDTDPSGEGQLLAWEAIDAIDFSGKIFRANFMDETPKSIRESLENLVPIASMEKDGEYQKGFARNRWDFLSMQLTRVATQTAKSQGFNLVSRQGRLKSTMLSKIYQQEQLIEQYVKKPFFEVKFVDKNDHVFSREISEKNKQNIQFEDKKDGEADLQKFGTSPITNIKEEKKHQLPPRLLDLSTLSANLSRMGFKAGSVLSTYQKMYENQIVSYPRTEDKTITPQQFYELLPLVDKIAAVVGVDTSLLTHKKMRPTHVKKQGSHGANRPGAKVPTSLESLSKYGRPAKAIYQTLAKNFLAMFAEDYEYLKTIAELEKYPEFKTMFVSPIQLNWKAVFNNEDEEEKQTQQKILGKTADPFLFEGSNKKPEQPTWRWLKNFLEQYDIGTGSTRTSTFSDLSSGNDNYIDEKRGKLSLTLNGKISAYLATDTYIADPQITKRVFDIFKQIGNFEEKPEKSLSSVTATVEHDLPIIKENSQRLNDIFQKPVYVEKEKITGQWEGQEVSIPVEFSGYRFSDEELEKLFNGQEISFEAVSKYKKKFSVKGKLANQTFKGKKFVGFKPEFEQKTKRRAKKLVSSKK